MISYISLLIYCIMEIKKTALIVEGGGQRGVFSFGITDTFIKRNYDPFDIYI